MITDTLYKVLVQGARRSNKTKHVVLNKELILTFNPNDNSLSRPVKGGVHRTQFLTGDEMLIRLALNNILICLYPTDERNALVKVNPMSN